MRRMKTQNDPWLPGPGAAVDVARTGAPSRPKVGSSLSPDRQHGWGNQLERQRLQMMKAHGPWLPGPGAQAATGKGLAAGIMKGGGGKSGKGSGDRPQLPLLLKTFVSFLPPQALKEMEEKGAKPIAEALWKVHELFVGSLKLSPFSLLTAGAFHVWWYAANFKNTEGLPKLGIGDLFRLIMYDSVVLGILALLLFIVVLLVLIVYAIMNPSEFAGFISGGL